MDASAAATHRRIRRDAAALGLAVAGAGLSFGALAVAAGLSPLQACVLSLFAFTGGSQFAYITSAGPLGSAVAAALLLGLRNVLYGVRLGALLPRGPLGRALAAHAVIDETTAMALAQPASEPALARRAFVMTGVAVFVAWNLATVGGVALGWAVGDPGRLGLDAAAPAAFLALLWPRLSDAVDRRVAATGAVIAAVGSVLLPAGLAIPAAVLAVLVAPWRSR